MRCSFSSISISLSCSPSLPLISRFEKRGTEGPLPLLFSVKFTPFPFQKVAAENVRKALAKGGRAQIVMACGTGKTVTMLLAAEALDAQRVLVLAPT